MSYQLQRPHLPPPKASASTASSSSSAATTSIAAALPPRGLSLQNPTHIHTATVSSSSILDTSHGPTPLSAGTSKRLAYTPVTDGIVNFTSPYVFPSTITDVQLSNTTIRTPLSSIPTQPPLLYQNNLKIAKKSHSSTNPIQSYASTKMQLREDDFIDPLTTATIASSTPFSPPSKSNLNHNASQDTSSTFLLIQPPGYTTTIQLDTASIGTEDEEWNHELAILEAVDNWKKYGNDNLPKRFRKVITSIIERYPGLQRVLLYQVLSYFEWKESWIEKIWLICSRIFHQTELIYILFQHISMLYHEMKSIRECKTLFQMMITFLYDLPYFLNDAKDFMPLEVMLEKQIHVSKVDVEGYEYEVEASGSFPSVFINEYLTAMTKDNQYYLLNLIRHLSTHEYQKLFQYVEELYYVEIKHRYQDVLSKHPPPPPMAAADLQQAQANDAMGTANNSILHTDGGSYEAHSPLSRHVSMQDVTNTSAPSSPFTPNRKKGNRPKSRQEQHMNLVKSKLQTFSVAIFKFLEQCHYLEAHLPTSKSCSLCRSKRLKSLEFRLVHNQVPQHMLHLPGNVAMMEEYNQWKAHDERQYEFNRELKQVTWQQSMVINLMEICEKCIVDVHEGLTSRGRFDAIHHYPPAQRMQQLLNLRHMELELAEVVIFIAETRLARRIREYILAAIQTQRLGLKAEALQREQEAIEAERQRQAQQAADEKRRMLEKALVSDKKWVRQDERTALYDLYKRDHFAHMSRNMEYDANGDRPAPMLREHGKSWKLKETLNNGMPLTAKAANALFGVKTPTAVDENEEVKLQEWKEEAEDLVQKLLEAKAERERKLRQQELVRVQTLKNYVNERIHIIERQHELLHHLAEEMEMNRLLKRQHDKEERRKQRFERYLNQERMQLEYEDHRSYLLRGYEFECIREGQEREDMFNEECDQCEIDHFWGIDAYEQRSRDEELRLRKFYEQHVYEMNQRLVVMGSVKGVRRKEIQLVPIGKLPEDKQYQDDDKLRRMKVIKKLKAEEIRSQLKLRMPTVFY